MPMRPSGVSGLETAVASNYMDRRGPSGPYLRITDMVGGVFTVGGPRSASWGVDSGHDLDPPGTRSRLKRGTGGTRKTF